MALLHAESFTLPPPWSQAEIEATLTSPFTFVLTRPQAFLLGQVVAGEATLLTIAVAPTARRRQPSTASTGTSQGSTPKIHPTSSGRSKASSQDKGWTRARAM